MVRAYAGERAAAEDRRGFDLVRSSWGTHAREGEHQGQAPDTPQSREQHRVAIFQMRYELGNFSNATLPDTQGAWVEL